MEKSVDYQYYYEINILITAFIMYEEIIHPIFINILNKITLSIFLLLSIFLIFHFFFTKNTWFKTKSLIKNFPVIMYKIYNTINI